MSMKEEYTAIDMSTAAADGFRDGQRAAQSAPAGERGAFEAWHCKKFKKKWHTGHPTRDMHNGVYDDKYGPEHQQNMWEAHQAGAAWQRAQVRHMVPDPLRDAITPHVVEWVRCGLAANNRLVDGDHPALKKIRAAIAAAQAQPAAQGYAIVPVDPTPKMLAAYMETDGAVKRWKAMVAAAKAEGVHV